MMKKFSMGMAIVFLAVASVAGIERDTALVLAATQGDAWRVEQSGSRTIVRLEDGRQVTLRELADGVEMRLGDERWRWRRIGDGWICGKRRLRQLPGRQWSYRDQDGQRYRIILTAKGAHTETPNRTLARNLNFPCFLSNKWGVPHPPKVCLTRSV